VELKYFLVLVMERKKRTPKTDLTPALLKFRAKRKWQIALRRYLLGQSSSSAYAPYFGLDFQNFRQWIELQFDKEMNWANFGSTWQLDHVVPVNFFDFQSDPDMRLCWNFINIRAERSEKDMDSQNYLDLLSAKSYFQTLYEETGFSSAKNMIQRIAEIERAEIASTAEQQFFVRENLPYLNIIADFNEYEFDKLNHGVSVKEILLERELLNKYK
jgi:hypothetical protein